MREDHLPLRGGRTDRGKRGAHPGRRRGRHQAGTGPCRGVPGCIAAALAHGARQCRLRSRMCGHQVTRSKGARRPFHRHGRPFRLRAALSLRAVRRHAAAGEPGACAGHGSEDPADGRTVRFARCADPRGHAGGAAADLGASQEDGVVRHPSDRRGDLPVRPRRGLLRTARPDQGNDPDRDCASAPAPPQTRGAFSRPRGSHLDADRGGRQRTPRPTRH